MSLVAGARLGPYEVLSPLGAGGMGEVWRARDPRLSREVAIKVLPASFASDPDRLRRFEQEARAAGALNHPNLTSVFDVGTHEGAPYLVEELLEGETLRAAMAGGRFAPRKAIATAVQIAQGLAAAHARGIVHRDLKPENVFVTKDGRVKILDFGLAKLTRETEGANLTAIPTQTRDTDAGTVLGTLGYMSPEQVRGQAADARSDIFALGAILYEMLAGQRAFRGDSAADTMSAILREDPPDLSVTNKNVAPGLERIVRHCLEKSPEQRFQSARDVAFDLEALSDVSAPATVHSSRARVPVAAVVAGGLAVALGIGLLAGSELGRRARPRSPAFHQLTFRQQSIFRARFAPDGRSIVFSAALKGNVPELFTVKPEFPDARPLGLGGGVHILSVSRGGEIALLTHARWLNHDLFQGTLSRMPLEGGSPREVLEGVREADFHPDGQELAIIREVDGKDRLEYPPGKVLVASGGYLSDPRFSPDGARIAFFEHPLKYDDRGDVAVVDLSGKRRVLAGDFWGEQGIAWSSDGSEVLFSAGNAYYNFCVYGVTLSGKRRIALASAGGLLLLDSSRDGRLLVKRDDLAKSVPVHIDGKPGEREMSWLDLSDAPVIARDGKTLLFSEESGSVGPNYAVCTRRTDGSPPVRLGEGFATDLTPDAKWALALVPTTPQKLALYPLGAGTPRVLDHGEVEGYESAVFFDAGRSVLACGHEPGHANRCWAWRVAGGEKRPITPDGTSSGVVSPDARRVLAYRSGAGLAVYPMDGGEGRMVPGTVDDVPLRWSRAGDSALVYQNGQNPARIERVDVATGKRELVRAVGPTDLTGVVSVGGSRGSLFISEDEKSWGYAYRRVLSQLFLVEGAR